MVIIPGNRNKGQHNQYIAQLGQKVTQLTELVAFKGFFFNIESCLVISIRQKVIIEMCIVHYN